MFKRQAVSGQRWVSDGEPELGLGILMKAEYGRVELFFPAAKEHRQYALAAAPLRRVSFGAGDKIKTHDGRQLLVEAVEEKAGLLIYKTAGGDVAEAQLCDSISFSKAEDRLLGGQIDDGRLFNLRVEALRRRAAIQGSQVRGFVGGRVELLAHQMYIASEVAGRLLPRVLLADEVGLGKTIEACLILHRLHLTGRASRVLVLLPEPLVNQWFVELLRRFNLLFSIFDEERCQAIEQNEGANPFLDSQLVLCAVDLLADNPVRSQQALEAGWDLLVVDEAHHLEWRPAGASAEYELVDALARRTPGVLLLTATPEQLGPEGHFARLRLLDPERYKQLDEFLAESERYEQVARAIERVVEAKTLAAADAVLFAKQSARLGELCEAYADNAAVTREKLVSELLDAFGTGRVMFRNTRTALGGFPQRKALLVALEGTKPLELKVRWLASLLKELGDQKVLLICKTKDLAELVADKLQRVIKIKCAIFHEELTLLQRDRNAAYFADEEGARILVCSEIGSEGRNFQFVHHLVLFDLPGNPELLEQRIGRLDRIGQSETIRVHVPYVKGDASEVWARWYHEGLNAFESNPHGAAEIARKMADSLEQLGENFDEEGFKKLLDQTGQEHAVLTRKLEHGHDRLLALNSSKPEVAATVIEQIKAADADQGFEEFVLALFDHFGVHCEELGNRCYLLLPGHLLTGAFPSLPDGGLSVTFERSRALSREDLGLMSGDHPMVRGALDLLLGSEMGNANFALWKSVGPESIFLEVYTVAECVGTASLHVERFWPPTPVRVVVDHALKEHDLDFNEQPLEQGDAFRLLDRGVFKKKLLPAMLSKAEEIAAQKAAQLQVEVATKVEPLLQAEVERLVVLQEINDHVRDEEIEAAKAHKQALLEALSAVRVRLDAVRLVLKTN